MNQNLVNALLTEQIVARQELAGSTFTESEVRLLIRAVHAAHLANDRSRRVSMIQTAAKCWMAIMQKVQMPRFDGFLRATPNFVDYVGCTDYELRMYCALPNRTFVTRRAYINRVIGYDLMEDKEDDAIMQIAYWMFWNLDKECPGFPMRLDVHIITEDECRDDEIVLNCEGLHLNSTISSFVAFLGMDDGIQDAADAAVPAEYQQMVELTDHDDAIGSMVEEEQYQDSLINLGYMRTQPAALLGEIRALGAFLRNKELRLAMYDGQELDPRTRLRRKFRAVVVRLGENNIVRHVCVRLHPAKARARLQWDEESLWTTDESDAGSAASWTTTDSEDSDAGFGDDDSDSDEYGAFR